MDTPTRQSVNSLVHHRSAGLISSVEFFERLSGLNFAGLDPVVPVAAWTDGGSPGVLTGAEVEAFLRLLPKEGGHHDASLDGSLADGSHPRERTESWSSSADALGVPALLTEQQATALVQEMGAPGQHASQKSVACTPPRELLGESMDWAPLIDADLPTLLNPLWSSSSISPLPGSHDAAVIPHSFSFDALSIGRHSLKSGSSSASGFSQRNELWELQKSQRREERRRQRDARELAECSFQPTILSTATRSSGSAGCTGDAATAARLCAPPPSARHSQAARRWKEKREDEEMRECSFAPDLSRSATSLHYSIRSLSASATEFSTSGPSPSSGKPGSSRSSRRSPRAVSASGCHSRSKDPTPCHSFAPITNPIASHMVSAHGYARQNVFCRLSQPQSESIQGPPHVPESEASSTKTQHSSKCPPQVSLALKSTEPPQDESFYRFLQRQNEFEEDRRQRLAEVERFTAPVGQPTLCTQSRKLARQRSLRKEKQLSASGQSPTAHRSGSPSMELEFRTGITAKGCFSARGPPPASPYDAAVSRSLADSGSPGGVASTRRQHRDAGQAAGKAQAHSFQPSITPAASRRPARSLSDLSSGDARQREARLAKMRIEAQNEMEKTLDFTPRCLTSSMSEVEGRLKLLKESDSYVKRMAEARLEQEHKRKKALEEKRAQELAECTFSPQVQNGPPSFVRQMAETYRSAKSLEVQDKPAPRPDWR